MRFYVQWLPHIIHGVIVKTGDLNNKNMYIKDNLGNRYDPIDLEGDAAADHRLPAWGAFVFSPAKEGAYSFTFYDDDNGKTIPDLNLLTTPAIIYDGVLLKWYPFAFDYDTTLWKLSQTEKGGVQLTYIQIPECQIQEWEPSEPQGKLKSILEIGQIEYQIYGWLETGRSVREYLAVSKFENVDRKIRPFFRVNIPLDNVEPCLSPVHHTLANLHPFQH